MKKYYLLMIFFITAYLLTAFDYSPKKKDTARLIHESKYDNAINIVFLGDGFTAGDIKNGIYERAVQNFISSFFYVPPFEQYQNYFNIYIVDCISKDSGADDSPKKDTKNTIFNATFGTSGIDRLLTIQNYTLADQYSKYATDNPHSVIILVNDPRYGGSGGYYSVASLSPSVFTLIMHEFGHSFGNLEDEYVDEKISANYPLDPKSLGANVDTAGDTKKIKWKNLIGISGYEKVGAYEGAYYRSKGVWRPQQNCCMKALGYAFCNACKEILTKKICSLIRKEYKFDEFITKNPIEKNDSELIVYNPVNNKNEKITVYEDKKDKDFSKLLDNEKQINNKQLVDEKEINTENQNNNKQSNNENNSQINLNDFEIVYIFQDGYYLYKGDNIWEERITNGNSYYYNQYDTDEYYIYITDTSRNKTLAIPIDHNDLYLWNGKVWELIYRIEKIKG